MPRSNPYTGCEDFHRTAATVRHPTVGVTRRHFLGLGMGAGLALYTARAMPLQHWLDGAAEAAAQTPGAPVLVSIFLPGGLDLLDSFLDAGQAALYQQARGSAARALTPVLKGTTISPHPGLTAGAGGGLAGLFNAGKVGLLPGIDYANPVLSHFRSRAFWETGTITARQTTGWLGRWLDRYGTKDNPFQGLTSGFRLSPTLLSSAAPVSSVESVRKATMAFPGVSRSAAARASDAYADLARPRDRDPTSRAAVRASARYAQEVAERLAPLAPRAPGAAIVGDSPDVPAVSGALSGYPAKSAFADSLRSLAFMLAQPLGVRIATVDCNGDFDTHSNQPQRLSRNLAIVSASLSAFQADLEARGVADHVVTFVWTEFGRRPVGNRSRGTDHGAGGIGWVIGHHARPGLLTEYPRLDDLDGDNNLKVTVDFRTVYASLIEQWLGGGADGVIPDANRLGRIRVVA